ncbi:MAG: hypothetical protein J7L90_01660, partial [Dehalococcoidia bacterium]|nr:hypothetical protein [Dehalococcoidia bacterium]
EWYGDGNQKWEYAGGTVSDPVIATFTVTSADVGKWIKVDLTPYTKALASGIPASLMLKMVNEDCQWEERYTHFKSKDTSTGRKPYITFE